jgi:5-amino-6-(5-phospho-D-ribitylamino)uracil phosphatase
MPRTLYVTDLDGTLLGEHGAFPDEDRDALAELVEERDLLLTYATARSFRLASRLVGTAIWRLPVIVHNGAFTVDPVTGRPHRTHLLAPDAVVRVIEASLRHGLPPAVLSLPDDGGVPGAGRIQWVAGTETAALRHFLDDRPGDPRFRPVATAPELAVDGAFGVTVMGECEPVARLAADPAIVALDVNRTLTQDTYHRQDTWLEVAAPGASKAGEALALRDALGADRLVCFGDNHNDLSLFAVADEAYAVANATAEVRAAATGVIGRNTESAVLGALRAREY